jgi:hypothetical protein
MNDYITLKLGNGIGCLTFGSAPSSVKNLLGNPSEEEIDPEGDIRWFFNEFCLNVYFGKKYDYRLHLIETSHPEAVIWGKTVMGLSKEEVLVLFESHGYKSPEVDADDDSYCISFYDECGCTLWCEPNVVTSVQLSVLFDNDDNIVWPADTLTST